MRFENLQEKYAKAITENVRKEKDSLEKELKHLETDLKSYKANQKYLDCISKLEEIYSRNADGLRIRSKCDWYESVEKPSRTLKKLVPLRV